MNLIFRLMLVCGLASGSGLAATFTVVNTLDAGPGSLREAIGQANTIPGHDFIHFNIPPGGLQTITVLSDLPVIQDRVTIDGTTQPGFNGSPVIELTSTGSFNTGAFRGLILVNNGNFVRGLIINRFQWYGIYLDGSSSSNHVAGNWIGLDATGSQPLGMNGNGITIVGGQYNLIGGTNAADRNVIAANTQYGVAVSGWHNLVQGNFIGTDVTGTNSLGNGYSFTGIGNWAGGVWIDGGRTNTIGGAVAGAGNLISGNVRGVVLLNNAQGNLVQGNLIGTTASGTARLPGRSQLTGIYVVSSSDNLVGGTNTFSRNVISGNGAPGQGTEGNGIYVGNSTRNVIQGNFIGTDITGTLSISNVFDGVNLNSAQSNLVGGTIAGSRNVISGNSNGTGVRLWTAHNNTIQGNFIGTTADGLSPLPNRTGIHVYAGNGNTIGGNSAAAGNTIAFNGPDEFGYGVYVSSIAPDTSTNNFIRRNSLFSNAGLGIRLFNINCLQCPPYNDAADTDTGPNDLLNFPVLTNALLAAGSLNLSGTYTSLPNSTVTLDFYANPELDPSGFGEGKSWIGSTVVSTDASGRAGFNLFFVDNGYAGQYITATATDLNRNSSEFSAALAVNILGGTLVLAEPSYSVSEPAGSITITVNRLADSTGPITVAYGTTDGSALAGEDYTSTVGVLSFADGETARSFSVPILNDPLNEPDETFRVFIANPTGGAVLGSRTNVQVTILDNDPITVSALSAAVTKPAAGSAQIFMPIVLNAGGARTGAVAFATASLTAEAGVDFVATNGVALFPPGTTNILIPVTVLADGLQEGAKAFTLNLSNPSNLLITAGQGIGTIYDGTQGVLQFAQANFVASENAGSATIQVSRVGGTLGAVSVSFSASGGFAIAGTDFTPTNGVVMFNPGQSQASFEVKLNDDLLSEPSETVVLQLFDSVGTSLGTPASAILSISDNDDPPLAIQAVQGGVELSWPADATGFQLMTAFAIPGSWDIVTNIPVLVGDKLVVTNSISSSAGFFRLQK